MAIKETKQRLNITLTKSLAEKLNVYSEKSGLSKSAIIGLALKNYLRNK